MEIAVSACVWIKQIDSSAQIQNERLSLQETLVRQAAIVSADDLGRQFGAFAENIEAVLNRLGVAPFSMDRQLDAMIGLFEEVYPVGQVFEEIIAKNSANHAVIDFKLSFYEQHSGKMFGEEVSRLNGSFRQR